MSWSKNNVTRLQPIAENVKKVIEKRCSIRKAADEFKVSKSFIGRYVKLNKENETTTVIYKANNAVKRVFNDEEEEQLVEYCLTVSKFYYGIPKEQFLELAYQYAVALNKTYPSSWDINKQAGKIFYEKYNKFVNELLMNDNNQS